MGWRISRTVEEILARGLGCEGIPFDDAVTLLRLPLHSREVYALMETASRLSRESFCVKGERHLHIGVDAAPCGFNCRFCSLAASAGVFTEAVRFTDDEIIAWAKAGEAEGADALNLMTTGVYSFGRLLEVGRMLKAAVSTPLVANTRDVTRREAEALLDAGFVGAYHAVRLREGTDTPFPPERRIETVRVLRDAGLLWMNCVEPVGPEHAPEEIARLMVLARDLGATYSGVMRRVNFPGSPCEPDGTVTERELARMVAVSRLVMGASVRAHCTHEPNALTLAAGANLLFPEVGSSPRDLEADTGKGRGHTMNTCASLLRETGWAPEKPSNCFEKA